MCGSSLEPCGYEGQDAAVLDFTEDLPNEDASLPIVTGVGASGGIFETCGFKTGTSFVANVEGRIGHTNPLGWVDLVGLNSLGIYIQHGFSGAPVWSVRHQAIVGMISAVDTEEENRVAYLIPWTRLKTALGLSQSSSGDTVSGRFGRRKERFTTLQLLPSMRRTFRELVRTPRRHRARSRDVRSSSTSLDLLRSWRG